MLLYEESADGQDLRASPMSGSLCGDVSKSNHGKLC